jgi:hypothetical protein
MRRVLSVLVTLTALLAAAATPALAQEPPPEQHRFSVRQLGLQADAFWQTCQPDTPEPGLTTCQHVNIFAFEGTMVIRSSEEPTQRLTGEACIGLTVTDDEFGIPITEENGCTHTFEFDAAADLSWASLSATVPVETFACTEAPPDGYFCEPTGTIRDVAVTAAWTASGPSTRFTDRSFSRTETDGVVCVFRQSGRGVRADATATAAVDGLDLGASEFASITEGRFRFVDRCR